MRTISAFMPEGKAAAPRMPVFWRASAGQQSRRRQPLAHAIVSRKSDDSPILLASRQVLCLVAQAGSMHGTKGGRAPARVCLRI